MRCSIINFFSSNTSHRPTWLMWTLLLLILALVVSFSNSLSLQVVPPSPPQRSSSSSSPARNQNYRNGKKPVVIGGIRRASSCSSSRSSDDDQQRRQEGAVVGRRNFLAVTAGASGLVLLNTVYSDAEAAEQPPREPLPSSSSTVKVTASEGPVPTTMTKTTTTTTTTPTTPTTVLDLESIFQKAGQKALGGGRAGALAAVVQVCSLMWLRTSMNYQYRYGGNLQSSLKTLWAEGGIPRLYQGLPFALVQGPLSKFGDTAANVGILALLDTLSPTTQNLPLPVKTACGSAAAGLWRIFLMPIDTSKTALQVQGQDGLRQLWQSVANAKSPAPLYRGAVAQAAATAAGHFPWFATYNFLNDKLPLAGDIVIDYSDFGGGVLSENPLLVSLLRSAFLGLAASCVSDCVSNSLRVIKTTKQTAQLGMMSSSTNTTASSPEEREATTKELSYPDVIALILEKDGIVGLFGRGLQTRLLTNAIQGSLFSVLWKYFQTLQ